MKPGTLLAGLLLAMLGCALVYLGFTLPPGWEALIVIGSPVGVLGGWIIGEGLGY